MTARHSARLSKQPQRRGLREKRSEKEEGSFRKKWSCWWRRGEMEGLWRWSILSSKQEPITADRTSVVRKREREKERGRGAEKNPSITGCWINSRKLWARLNLQQNIHHRPILCLLSFYHTLWNKNISILHHRWQLKTQNREVRCSRVKRRGCGLLCLFVRQKP